MKLYFDKIKSFFSSKNNTFTVVGFFGLFLLATGISVIVFSFFKGGVKSISPAQVGQTRSKININLPKTEECPMNGQKYTTAEKQIWDTRRPIAAMIENHADSRPPSGISKADIVYEAVAEGGITRFLSIFYCGSAAEDVQIAPVRSARVYFVNFASEYGDFPIFMHIGGANNYSGSGDTASNVRALELLETIGWRVPKGNDFDTTYDSGFPVFWRNYDRLDHTVPTEHTMMASLDATYQEAQKRGFGAKDSKGNAWNTNFIKWNFADDKPAASPASSDISFGFWKGMNDYDVEWKYDAATNSYLRFNGGKEHVDLTTKKQLSAKNVVIFFAQEAGPVDRNLHMFYTTIGTGNALLFQNGQVTQGSWEKDSRTGRTKFMDKGGKEVAFVRGTIWIEVVPAGNQVKY